MSTRVLLLGTLLISGIIGAAACASSDSTPLVIGQPNGSGSTPTGSGSTPTTTGTNPTTIPGSGGTTGLSVSVGTDSSSGPRQVTCENPNDQSTCSCVNIASIGMVAKYGANNDSTDAFMNWLATKSTAGSVTKLTTRDQVVLTADALAKFDILVLQHLTSDGKQPAWVFTDAEVQAVRSWVVDKGGSLMVMTGYESSNTYEIAPTNQLLAFTGIQIDADDITGAGAAQIADCNSLCPPSNSICCSCWHGPQKVTEWDTSHPISAGITAEPIYRGRSVSPGDGQIVAKHRGFNVAVAKQVGNGRVFVYGDEWITYTSQWQDNADVGAAAASNPCYDTTTGKFRNAANTFQVGRLWYNAIRWLQPAMTCFTIEGILL
jgi:hypothetical protein